MWHPPPPSYWALLPFSGWCWLSQTSLPKGNNPASPSPHKTDPMVSLHNTLCSSFLGLTTVCHLYSCVLIWPTRLKTPWGQGLPIFYSQSGQLPVLNEWVSLSKFIYLQSSLTQHKPSLSFSPQIHLFCLSSECALIILILHTLSPLDQEYSLQSPLFI